MNHRNSETRIRPKSWDDRPARGRKDHDSLFPKSFEGEAHAYRCPASGASEMAMTEIFTKGYFYFLHSSLTALKIANCKIENANLK
jgi:hypothetical protein